MVLLHCYFVTFATFNSKKTCLIVCKQSQSSSSFHPLLYLKKPRKGGGTKTRPQQHEWISFFHPHPDVSKPEDLEMCEYVHGKMDYDDFFVASLDGRVLNFKSSLFIEKQREERVTGKQEGNFSLQNTFPGDYVSQMRVGTFKGLHLRDYSKNYQN